MWAPARGLPRHLLVARAYPRPLAASMTAVAFRGLAGYRKYNGRDTEWFQSQFRIVGTNKSGLAGGSIYRSSLT
jgi:hypothetical protein